MNQFKTGELQDLNGNPWKPSAAAVTPKRRDVREAGSYHKGWRVVGHAPGALEKARDFSWQRLSDWEAKPDGQKLGISPPKPWNEDHWMRNGRKTAVRNKPYEVPEAAQQCKSMAEKAGWLAVDVIALAKEART